MQRLACMRLGTRLLRNPTNPTPSFQSKSLISLSKTNPNHLNSYSAFNQFHRFSPQFTTLPHSPGSSVLQKIYGFLSNHPVVAKKLLSCSLFRGTGKGLADSRFGFFSPKRVFEIKNDPRPWQSWFRRQTADSMVLGLILANVAVFMLWRIADRQFMLKNFTISVDNFRSGRVHTLITSAFSHVDTGHLVSNMIGLYFFGLNIGRVFGPEFTLKLYLCGAVVGSIFYLVHHAFIAKNERNWMRNPSAVPGMGASGAVNAIMLLDIFLFPKSTLYLQFFIPVPAILLGIFLIGKDVMRILEGDSQVSGSAHLGGAMIAAVTWAGIRKGRF